MGSRGPVGKRDGERMGHRTKAEKARTTALDVSGVVDAPEPSGDWHPVAARWFESLAESGQSVFYEPSDWATAYLVAESMSRELLIGEPPSAASLSAWLKAMTSLMVTEGDRRRFRLEIERVVGGDAEVTSLDDFRSQLAKG